MKLQPWSAERENACPIVAKCFRTGGSLPRASCKLQIKGMLQDGHGDGEFPHRLRPTLASYGSLEPTGPPTAQNCRSPASWFTGLALEEA
jgi:hypothetical protein